MMIVRHKVRDYGQWRPIFDQHAEMQRAAGLINPRVYHSADSNKSEIVVVFDTEDTKKAKEFAASADLKEAMTKAGVIRHPKRCRLRRHMTAQAIHFEVCRRRLRRIASVEPGPAPAVTPKLVAGMGIFAVPHHYKPTL